MKIGLIDVDGHNFPNLAEYEYKHRACLAEIHAIDDVINSVYGLTQEESDYIKDFALRYRVSGGVVSDECD